MGESASDSRPQLELVATDGLTLPEPEPEVSFDDFWILYPRKVAKKDARMMWGRIDDSLHVQIVTTLVIWRTVWRDKDSEYLPYPATWLNGERWEDEVPPGYLTQRKAKEMKSADPTGPRTAMPDHVRSLIAKLKEGRK